ncbi:MAG TPA: MBL fold metallo-hydrolase [Coleofasciculaceae cyanobacterium]
MENQFVVTFWGVRGSIACPGPETVRYGGNTPCVEMHVEGNRLIFDGGTGIRVLGQSLLDQGPLQGHIFFTHSHWDHIQGFPFFAPAFVGGNQFHIYGAVAPNLTTIEQRLQAQMHHPNFPVPIGVMAADLRFHDVQIGQPIQISPDVWVENALLNHPGQAIGYRVNCKGCAVAYVTDTEHFPDRLDENVLYLAQNADMLIYDATYTNEEYYSEHGSKMGWGHSTWQEAVKVAKAANVKRLVLFHHDPLHTDRFLDQVGEQLKQAFPGGIVAQEGTSLMVSNLTSVSSWTLLKTPPVVPLGKGDGDSRGYK